MLRIDRICTTLFILAFAFLIPSVKIVTFTDELIAGLMGLIAVADCVVNQAWRRYTILWIIVAVMTFYAAYSLIFMHFNTPSAIITDWIIQLKPYVPFVVFLAVRPTFTTKQKQLLRYIAIINAAICALSFFLPKMPFLTIMGHISYPGTVLLLCAIVYAYTSESNHINPKDAIVIIAMLSAGLLCGRSKYYGEFIISIFLLFFYTRFALNEFSLRRKLLIVVIPLLVIAAGWAKFQYYFLTGESTSYDPDVLESYARPVLYATGALVLIDYIPFGSGLASFCSWASTDPYSTLYHEYGISSVYGLSPTQPFFICDAFYPSLAQFGLVGVILFAIFWIYVIILLKRLIHKAPERSRLLFAIGWIITLSLLIESIASTTIVQTSGMCAMMLLGVICSHSFPNRQIKQHHNE